MGLNELDIRDEYRSLLHNIAEEFLIPALQKATAYDRAVGFFSSTVLASIAYGIEGLARNSGKIRLIASPKLSEEDIEAIKKGYRDREEVINASLSATFTQPENYGEQERLNLLANLIRDGILDIRIALIDNDVQLGLYHEKLGIIRDNENSIIAFSGSMNETNMALNVNYEAIDVFCSWHNEVELNKTQKKVSAFEAIWNNCEPGIVVMDFPETVKRNFLQTYYREKVDYSRNYSAETKKIDLYPGARVPEGFQFHKYQEEAIEEWCNNGYRGIFDMATGTGKTYTGLGAIAALNQRLKGHLAAIIVAPYQHLVEQWVEDIELFGMQPIIGYSDSIQKDWKSRLDKAIRYQKIGTSGCEFFCFICTNATFAKKDVQDLLSKIKGNKLLVVDEAHNFGATTLKATLNDSYQYRLALSATLERHHDEQGTQQLYDFFGSKCIEYSLERAINEHKLTRYKYYPVIINLTPDELDEYYRLTERILKCMKVDKNGKYSLTDTGKRLCIKRARLVAAAKNKVQGLAEVIAPYVGESHILVYCGAASLHDFSRDDYQVEAEDVRQIDVITDLLGNQLNMKVSQYTSREDIIERKILKDEFAKGETLQALIAIKCLDEGVNIPSIKMAFILASTTNPKEYIQRRGRVLRLYEGKDFAIIFDFITLPQSLHASYSATDIQLKMGRNLARNELVRAYEFAQLADNFVEADRLLDEIRDAYNLHEQTYISEEEEFESYVKPE